MFKSVDVQVFRMLGVQSAGCIGCSGRWVLRVFRVFKGARCSGCWDVQGV